MELLVSHKGRTQVEDVLEEVTGEEGIVFHGGFHNLFYSPNIACVINPRGTRWARHFTHVGEKIHARNILVEQPERMILLGRPKYRRENSVKRDLKDIEWESVYWIQLVLFKEMGWWGGGGRSVLKNDNKPFSSKRCYKIFD